MMDTRLKKIFLLTLFYMGLGVILFVSLFPFYYAVITSFASGSDLYKVSYLPKSLDFGNYVEIFTKGSFLTNFGNSIVVSFVVVAISLLLGVGASYSLARVDFRGRGALLFVILSTSMFPQVSVLSGMYEIIKDLKLFNTLFALYISYMIFSIPFTVWVLTTFMRSFPKELESAALIDGAGTLTIIFRIILPIMWPSLVSVGLLTFIAAWNEYLFALTFTSSDEIRTVPVAIAMLSGATEYELPWGKIMAASVLVTLPLIVVVLIFQEKIVSGLTEGAVKG